MLTFEIPVIAMFYPSPPLNTGRGVIRQEIEWGLLTGCVYIIIVSTENKPSSNTKWTRKRTSTSD